MVKNNGYIIPKENYKKVEEVREIKNEIPTYEEFMKNYNADEKINDSYGGEVDSYDDLRIKGNYYGPGFWDDIKGVVKPVASVALVAASMFPPTAPVAMTITFGVAGASATTAALGNATDSKGLTDFSKDLAEIALNGLEAQK